MYAYVIIILLFATSFGFKSLSSGQYLQKKPYSSMQIYVIYLD